MTIKKLENLNEYEVKEVIKDMSEPTQIWLDSIKDIIKKTDNEHISSAALSLIFEGLIMTFAPDEEEKFCSMLASNIKNLKQMKKTDEKPYYVG